MVFPPFFSLPTMPGHHTLCFKGKMDIEPVCDATALKHFISAEIKNQ